MVVHAATLKYHDAARTQELLNNLGTPVLGMIVNGICRADSGYAYGYGYGNYRSHGTQTENGSEVQSLPSLATT